jgi:hypothetical protein
MRLALLLMLTGKVQLDAGAYQQAGGDAGFASLVHDLDPRIRCASTDELSQGFVSWIACTTVGNLQMVAL